MGRQSIEDLVRESQSVDRLACVGDDRHRPGRQAELSQPSPDGLDPAWVDFVDEVADVPRWRCSGRRLAANQCLDERRRQRAFAGTELADRERRRRPDRRVDARREPRERPAEDRVGLGGGQEIARRVRAEPSAIGSSPRAGSYSAISMNRANVIGPSRRISASDRGEQGGIRRNVGGRTRDAPQVHGDRRPSARRRPGPTRVWPPRRIGSRRVDGRGRQVAQPSVVDPLMKQQVRREAVRRRGPAGLVSPGAMGEEDPAIDERGIAQLGKDRPQPARARPIQRGAEDRSRRPLPGDTGPEPSLLDERARPRAGVSLQPCQARRRRPTGHDQLGRWIARDAADEPEPRDDAVGDALRRSREPEPPREQDEVQRPIDVDPEPPAAAQVARPRIPPARQASGERRCPWRGQAAPRA